MEFLFGPIDYYMEITAKLIGQQPSGVRLLLSFFLIFPLSLGFRLKLIDRHFYSIITGGLLQMFVFREGVIHFAIMTLITKLLMHIIDRKHQPWIIFSFALGYSSYCMILDVIYRFRSPEIGISFYIIILCNKLSTLGFCYNDGMKDPSHLDKHRLRCKLDRIPTLYELISYNCYPAGSIIGPYFEFRDYINFIEQKEQYSDIPLSLAKGSLKYLQSIMFMGTAVYLCQFVNIDLFVSEEYNQSSLLTKLFLSWLNITQYKYKAMSVWLFADGANIISGFSYSGDDENKNPLYQTIVAIKVWDVEFGKSPRDIISAWNHQTACWLRYYVYDRVKKNKKENEERAAFVTFMVSAFWHGFYPGYYLFFVCIHCILSISKTVYKFRRYFVWMPDYMKWIVSNLFFWLIVGQVGSFHICLQLSYAWNMMINTYFIGVAPIVVLYTLSWIIPTPQIHHQKSRSTPTKDQKLIESGKKND